MPLNRRVGVLEVGQIENGLTVDFEKCILIGDRCRVFVVNDARSTQAPQRRRSTIAFASGEFAVLEFGDVAVAACRALGCNARLVLGHDTERLHEAIAEVVGQRVAVGMDDVALRLLERDVALGRQRARALIVDDFVGRQDVFVVVNLDVAACRDARTRRVVNQLVALQVQRLRFIERFLDRAEHSTRLFAEGTCTAARPILNAWVLRFGNRCKRQTTNDDSADCPPDVRERTSEACRPPALAPLARRSATLLRCPRSTHHSTVLLAQKHRRRDNQQ